MARIRTIKPEFWTDEKVAALPRTVRLTFIGIISALADDEGRLRGNPRVVRGAVYPMDDDITAQDVAEHLQEIGKAKLVELYTVNGESFIQIRNWKKHQKIDKPTPSRLPAPPTTEPLPIVEASPNGRRALGEGSRPSGAEASGSEAKGLGAERSGNSLIARFLDRFYPATKPERRTEVKAQLDATLTEAGARLDRHNRVKANDEAHLTKCIKAVLNDPPDKSDAAVVWVLKKLSDPILDARGRTVTEAASEHAKSEGKRFDARIAEQRKAAAEWAKSHADELQEIERQAGVEFPANAPMGELMRKQWILDRITERIESLQNEAVA